MECCCYLRNVQDLLADGKTPYERRFGEPFKGPVIPCGAMVEYHHQFGKNVSRGIFLGYELIEGENMERRHLVADIEELGISRRPNAKKVLTPRRSDHFILPATDGTAKLFGTDHEFREPTFWREQLVRSEELGDELQGEPGEPQPIESKDDAEAR